MCNNYGFISDEAKTKAITMPAFMHWSWVHTGGEMMVANLQGVRGDDGYTPLRLILFMTCNSNYIMLYQNKSGVRLATRPLFLRVRTGAAHLGSHGTLFLCV